MRAAGSVHRVHQARRAPATPAAPCDLRPAGVAVHLQPRGASDVCGLRGRGRPSWRVLPTVPSTGRLHGLGRGHRLWPLGVQPLQRHRGRIEACGHDDVRVGGAPDGHAASASAGLSPAAAASQSRRPVQRLPEHPAHVYRRSRPCPGWVGRGRWLHADAADSAEDCGEGCNRDGVEDRDTDLRAEPQRDAERALLYERDGSSSKAFLFYGKTNFEVEKSCFFNRTPSRRLFGR